MLNKQNIDPFICQINFKNNSDKSSITANETMTYRFLV